MVARANKHLFTIGKKTSVAVNILLTNYMETLSPGGINRVVRELGKALSKKDHNVTVLQGNPLHLAREEIYEGFKIVRIESPLEKHFHSLNGKLYFYLKKHFKELDPQVVHLHGHVLVTPEVFYAISQICNSIPTVVNFHVDAFSGTLGRRLFWNLYAAIDKNVAKKATYIVADSNFEADYVRKTFCVREDKLSTIHLGVDPLFEQALPKQRNKRHNEEIKMLFVGYLIKRKNVQAILYALHTLVYELENAGARLTIIGSGPEKAALMHLAKELKLDDRITWKESLSETELLNELQAADVFLLLSKSEAYGIAVAEALSAGTPCIVANTAALREFTAEPGCFGVENPSNPEAVAELVLYIQKNEILVGPFSDKIRTWGRVVQDYEALYQNLLGAPTDIGS